MHQSSSADDFLNTVKILPCIIVLGVVRDAKNVILVRTEVGNILNYFELFMGLWHCSMKVYAQQS